MRCKVCCTYFWRYFQWRKATDNGRKPNEELDKTKKAAAECFKYVADAEQADPDPEVNNIAFLACAQCYYNGFGFDRNFDHAFEYLEKAINNGFSMADPTNLILSHCWSGAVGSNMEVPLEKAFQYLKDNAGKSDILQTLYGFFLYKGQGCKVDYEGARKAFERVVQSSNNNSVTKKCQEMAWWCLGICSYFGKGKVPKDKEQRAIECFAQSRDRVGDYCKTVCEFEKCLSGTLSVDEVRSIFDSCMGTFEKLKEQMEEAANMIFLLKILKHVVQNAGKRQQLLKLEDMAENDKADSSYNLCLSYNYGACLLEAKKFTAAAKQFQRVATQSGQEKQFVLKEFLKKRQGHVLSSRWPYIEAEANAQKPNSQFLMGVHHYLAGRTDEALDYFEKAAEADHGEANFAYAFIQQKEDLDKIRRYAKRAANRENCLFEAQYWYGELLLTKGEESEAAHYLQLAAQEVLRRRQCQELHIESEVLFYDMIPAAMTGHVTDNYFQQQFRENFRKLFANHLEDVERGAKFVAMLANIPVY